MKSFRQLCKANFEFHECFFHLAGSERIFIARLISLGVINFSVYLNDIMCLFFLRNFLSCVFKICLRSKFCVILIDIHNGVWIVLTTMSTSKWFDLVTNNDYDTINEVGLYFLDWTTYLCRFCDIVNSNKRLEILCDILLIDP